MERVPYNREESALLSNADWFKKFALTVREIVVEHGGAVVMTIDELREAVIEEDSSFADCPVAVLSHPTLSLRTWAQLEVGSFDTSTSVDTPRGDILIIHFSSIPREVARARCKAEGLSESVNILLLETASA